MQNIAQKVIVVERQSGGIYNSDKTKAETEVQEMPNCISHICDFALA